MSDMKRDLPKPVNFAAPGVVPVFATFNVDALKTDNPVVNRFNFPSGTPATLGELFDATKSVATPKPVPQQPTPVTTPTFHFPNNTTSQPTCAPQPAFEATDTIPTLDPPVPPKLLIPSLSSPNEFSFSVPSKAEMQLLAAEVQAYHTAYVAEHARFEEALNKYENQLQFLFTNEQKVRAYLEIKERLLKQRAEMEGLHTLCLERWGSVAKFSGFTG
jgi:hypothetical protein